MNTPEREEVANKSIRETSRAKCGGEMIAKSVRRPHRKSRAGCINCKRRRVKCDEGQPSCQKCIRQKAPCVYTDYAGGTRAEPASLKAKEPGPGHAGEASQSNGLGVTAITRMPAAAAVRRPNTSSCDLNMEDLGLLHHFTIHTAPSLTDNLHSKLQLGEFWAGSVVTLALETPFLMHMILAVAARHTLWLGAQDVSSSRRTLSLAQYHFSRGVSGLARHVLHMDTNNCGALYLTSLLVCCCRLAAGPADPGDLLICNVLDTTANSYMELIQGVRHIRAVLTPDVLLAGLEPLQQSEAHDANAGTATWLIARLPRVDWIEHTGALRSLVNELQPVDNHRALFLRALDRLESIYEATYGLDGEGLIQVHPGNRYIMVWLYELDVEYVDAMKQRHPIALLLLIYFAPLLHTHSSLWHLKGWATQIVFGCKALLPSRYLQYVTWPMQAAGLSPSTEGTGEENFETVTTTLQ